MIPSVLSALLASVFQPPPAAAPDDSVRPLAGELTYEQARHLLVRAGFGGTPERIEEIRRMGLEGAVRHLVDYETITAGVMRPHGVQPTRLPPVAELRRLPVEERRESRREARRRDRRSFGELRDWWVGRMVASPRPLEEKMTLFWHGHFTSEYRAVRNAYHMALQNDLFRQHATGNFAELVHAVSRDPAMLRYLDNDRNSKRAPNENYARELMELFTLGEGNYTERDIAEAARAFTGWTVLSRASVFVFARRNHDFGEKEILGQRGRFDGDDVVRILLEQEAAPRFLARKLLAFFAVDPTEAELEPYAEILRRTSYEIKPVFRALFSSEWFYSDRVRGRQVKSPIVLAVGTLRAMGVKGAPGAFVASRCEGLGQGLFAPPDVKGWREGPAWITSSSLLARYDLCRELVRLAKGGTSGPRRDRDGPARWRLHGPRFSAYALVRDAGVEDAGEIVELLERRFLVLPLAPGRRQALADFLTGADGSEPLDLAVRSSAERKLDGCLHLLTTTPEFQIH